MMVRLVGNKAATHRLDFFVECDGKAFNEQFTFVAMTTNDRYGKREKLTCPQLAAFGKR